MDLQQDDSGELMRAAAEGNRDAAGALLDQHRGRLRRIVQVRMNPRVTARVDASDVVQETMCEASRRLPQYFADPPIPFLIWLRQIAAECLAKLHRHHLGAQKRTVNREAPAHLVFSDRSSVALANYLVSGGTSPSGQLMRAELLQRVQLALKRLRGADRKILLLRHLEQLSIAEIAAVLGISETAAMSRHFRAIRRLHAILGNRPAEIER